MIAGAIVGGSPRGGTAAGAVLSAMSATIFPFAGR